MKIRKVPLGYAIVDGQITVDDKELALVRHIFTEYCNGVSLKALVDSLNGQNVQFNLNGGQWNKGRIHHILVDRSY